MRLTMDFNILVYPLAPRDPARQQSALKIVRVMGEQDAVLTMQSLAECLHVSIRKRIASREATLAHVADLCRVFREPVTSSLDSFQRATQAWPAGRFGFWDAMLLAAAGAAGCEVVISEDMRDGATFDRVRVVGAFDADRAISAAARAVLGLA
jgi:predicted nucleic acid-binding protein